MPDKVDINSVSRNDYVPMTFPHTVLDSGGTRVSN